MAQNYYLKHRKIDPTCKNQRYYAPLWGSAVGPSNGDFRDLEIFEKELIILLATLTDIENTIYMSK